MSDDPVLARWPRPVLVTESPRQLGYRDELTAKAIRAYLDAKTDIKDRGEIRL